MEQWRIFELIQMGFFTGAFALVAFPIARAIGNRIMHGRVPRGLPAGAVDERVDERLDDLSGEVAALRQQLHETQERLDFTERMLAQQKQRDALPPGAR